MNETNLTTFRANHPGLYDQAVEKGADTERERCSEICELAEAAGAPVMAVRQAIDGGLSPRDLVATFSRYASSSDSKSAAFVAKVRQLRLVAPSATGSSSDPADDLIARMRGGSTGASTPAPARAARSGPSDNMDLVADAMGLAATSSPPTASVNNVDLVARAMSGG